ncbi:3-hexulose-6-phosphate synthase [Virgibacillus halodenitrificans]|uniref:3-hexulose-6-phosphate synthase n=1 Tax=Virgibacillus halodenitrificans TaxID=1482 RepID=UPI002DBA016E|nr:3-hexulose-6-phosphate synthase [Virgibacillus halodenitrificans]MEC2159589.1 orotidine 5'-phosphate decarboxylase [Virgibacillus halodenitrificans]
MNLQLALDRLDWDTCFQVVEDTEEAIDYIEIGTGVIKEYGMAIVREMRKRYPDKVIVADMKICDAGKHEAKQAFEAGADITTVMAFASPITIQDTMEVARECDKQVMVDLLGVTSQEQIRELNEINVMSVGLHIGKDQQQKNTFHHDLFSLVKGYDFNVTVAGGINLETLPQIVERRPDTVIVGSAITKAEKPKRAAQEMKHIMKEKTE